MIPLITQGQVTAQDPPNGLMVLLKNIGQMGSFRVSVLRDYADARRVRQKPLPQLGTWGMVIFPSGDLRNGIWIGSYYPSMLDALTTTQASGFAPTDGWIDYEATFPGEWWLLDGKGNYAKQWTDQSFFTAAAASGLPTAYRHTVDNNQQKAIAYPYSDRVASPPASAFYFDFHHGSGTDISVNPVGSVTLSGSVSGIYTALFGGTKMTIDTTGNTTVSGASSATLSIKFGGATLTISNAGLAHLDLPGSETFNVTQGGAAASDALVLVSKFVAAFNAHVHGTSGPPNTPLTPTGVKSAVIDVSS